VSTTDLDRSPLAYKDEEFLDSEEARPLRILAEYMQPMRALAHEGVVGTIVFFGSARIRPGGPMHRFYDDAVELAGLVTQWCEREPALKGCVVCTGGMKVVASLLPKEFNLNASVLTDLSDDELAEFIAAVRSAKAGGDRAAADGGTEETTRH
jgi:hypothetical protein